MAEMEVTVNIIDDLYGGTRQGPQMIRRYPGSLAQFRAGMERLRRLAWGSFLSKDGCLLHFTEQGPIEPAHAVWIIEPSGPYLPASQEGRRAEIEASEMPAGDGCMIDFWDDPDALFPEQSEPIYGLDALFDWVIGELWPEDGQAEEAKPETATPSRMEGPSAETIRRAWLFRRLKDDHPEYSYAAVALNASCENQAYAAHDVRNAYRAMGWKWERADRIR